MASKKTPVVEVSVTTMDRYALAHVKADGKFVDAEIQWWPDTPFRRVIEGRASRLHHNPAAFALSNIRHNPPSAYQVTARVQVGSKYIYSEPVEVNIN